MYKKGMAIACKKEDETDKYNTIKYYVTSTDWQGSISKIERSLQYRWMWKISLNGVAFELGHWRMSWVLTDEIPWREKLEKSVCLDQKSRESLRNGK